MINCNWKTVRLPTRRLMCRISVLTAHCSHKLSFINLKLYHHIHRHVWMCSHSLHNIRYAGGSYFSLTHACTLYEFTRILIRPRSPSTHVPSRLPLIPPQIRFVYFLLQTRKLQPHLLCLARISDRARPTEHTDKIRNSFEIDKWGLNNVHDGDSIWICAPQSEVTWI